MLWKAVENIAEDKIKCCKSEDENQANYFSSVYKSVFEIAQNFNEIFQARHFVQLLSLLLTIVPIILQSFSHHQQQTYRLNISRL